MENIIKKIEALQPRHDLVESYEDEPTYDQGWERAINVVAELLDNEMEELIEEIKGLSTGLDITYKFDNGFQECKTQVLDLLKSSIRNRRR